LRCAETAIDLVDNNQTWADDRLQQVVKDQVKWARTMDIATVLGACKVELTAASGTPRQPYATAAAAALAARCQLFRLKTDPEGRDLAVSPAIVAATKAEVAALLELTADRAIDQRAHPFVFYQLMRALTLIEYCGDETVNAGRQLLTDRVREIAEALIAKSQLEGGGEADAVALAFCAASLALSAPAEHWGCIRLCLELAAAGQDASGCWARGRSLSPLIDPDRDDDLVIAPLEISLAVVEAMLALARSGRGETSPLPASAMEAIWGAVANIDQTRREVSGASGWAGSAQYGVATIEALSTALVVTFMVRQRQLLEKVARIELIPSFDLENPREEYWPDWLRWEDYKVDSEPDSDNPILEYIDREVVQVTHKRATERPYPWARAEQITVILFGPPGTTKTTIVRAVAEGLGWPLVTLGPGDFIQDGLEMVEKRADSIFSALHTLTETVVLFDECDELFRTRQPQASPDQVRGIAAFVTASMLPKLQDLHDRGQTVLFILTNNFETMDPAIKRLGRVDHIIGVGPPDDKQREVILRQAFKEELGEPADGSPVINAAVEVLAGATDHNVRGELVRMAKKVAGGLPQPPNLWRREKAVALAKEQLKKAPEKSVTEPIYDQFKKDLASSLAHTGA
jgi:hypothetical protein